MRARPQPSCSYFHDGGVHGHAHHDYGLHVCDHAYVHAYGHAYCHAYGSHSPHP